MQKISLEGKSSLSNLTSPDRRSVSLLGNLVQPADDELLCFERCLQQNNPDFLQDHQIYQTILVPATAYISMAIAAGIAALGTQKLRLEGLNIKQALPLFTSTDSPRLRTALKPAGEAVYRFEISSKCAGGAPESPGQLHASGLLRAHPHCSPKRWANFPNLPAALLPAAGDISVSQYYQEMRSRGFTYGPQFQKITRIWNRQCGILGEVSLAHTPETTPAQSAVHPVLLDACFQLLGTQLPDKNTQDVYLPIGISRMDLFENLGARLFVDMQKMHCHDVKQNCLSADFNLLLPEGYLAANFSGVSFLKISRRILERSLKKMRRKMQT